MKAVKSANSFKAAGFVFSNKSLENVFTSQDSQPFFLHKGHE
jgi:hypothetical protein